MSSSESKELSHPEIGNQPSVHQALERFDLADDEKIISALSKRVTAGFTYKVNGKSGLSSSGVLWAAREFAKQGEVYRVVGDVDIKPCQIDPDYINVTLKVQRFFVNPATGQEIALDSTIGHKRMSRLMKRYTDENDPTKFEMIVDPEYTTKCITKAERNGKLKLMPKDAVTNLIAKATGQSAGGTPSRTSPGKPSPQKAATPPASGPAAPPAAGASSAQGTPAATPPQQAQKPAAPQPPAAAPAGAAAPAAPQKPPPVTREVKIQKLDAVSKMVFGTSDGVQARAKLAQITGKASPSDLSDEEIKNVGNAINAVAKKTAKIEGNNILKISDNSILWKGPEVAAAPAEEPPAQEEEMF